MKPEQITALVFDLNQSLFKGNLQVEYHNCVGDKSAWGPHTWLLKYMSGGQEWASRVFWLKNARWFEMRHGGGGHFAWWIDQAIQNEVALRFDGTQRDDAGERAWKGEPGKYNNLADYLGLVVGPKSHHTKPDVMKQLLEWEREFVPPEFMGEIEKCLKTVK
jgi:hypothetical protein